MERKDNGLRACIKKGDFEQSMRVKVKRKWGKTVTYAYDATIMTKLNKNTIKRIIAIYAEHRKRSGLLINEAKTEVYVVQKELSDMVQQITTELGLKNTTNQIVRYLGHKFRPLVKDNTDKLKSALKTIKWLTNKFRRTQNVTIQGRIANASAIITAPLRFQLHGIHLN